MRRWYVCTSLCSQKYVLLSCGLILTDFFYLSSGASINLDCAGNTYRLLFFDYGIAVFDGHFLRSAFFFCRPHTGAHGGFWKNLLPVPLPHTQPTRRQRRLTVPCRESLAEKINHGFPFPFRFFRELCRTAPGVGDVGHHEI